MKKHLFHEMCIGEIGDYLANPSEEVVAETGFTPQQLATLNEIVESIVKFIEFHSTDDDESHLDLRKELAKLGSHRHQLTNGLFSAKPEV